jgi:transposase
MAVTRVWTADEKREIIAEYEAAKHGSKQSTLLRFGVSEHQLRSWRTARDEGVLDAGLALRSTRMTPRRESAEIARLRAQVEHLNAELDRARQDVDDRQKAVEALGKATALLHELVSSKSAADPCRPERSGS